MECQRCSREVKEAWRMCPFCGNALGKLLPPRPAPPMRAGSAPTARKINRTPRSEEEEKDLRDFLEEHAAKLFAGQSDRAYGNAGAVCNDKIFREKQLSEESIIFSYNNLRQSVVVKLTTVIGYWPSAIGAHRDVLARLDVPQHGEVWDYRVYVVPASLFEMETARLPKPPEHPGRATLVPRPVAPGNGRRTGDERSRRIEELIAP